MTDVRHTLSLPLLSKTAGSMSSCFLCKKTSGNSIQPKEISTLSRVEGDFPGGAVVKDPPGNAGDLGSTPGPGRYHMQWSN